MPMPGIRGKLLDWIRSFLSNRKQRVIINGVCSDLTAVTSGIPQGSVLGPTLFLIYVNDLPETVSSHLKMFAEDTKIYRPIEENIDKEILQNDLDKLMKWSDKWHLPFNIGKCKILHLGTNNPRNEYSLSLNNTRMVLEAVEKRERSRNYF